jgi:hypothetical protein
VKKNEIDLFSTLIIKCENFITENQRIDILKYIDTIKNKFKFNVKIMSVGASTTFPIDDLILDSIQKNIPSCCRIKDDIQSQINSYSLRYGVYQKPIDNSWISIQPKGSKLNKHVHTKSTISGVIYLQKNKSKDNTVFYSVNPYLDYMNKSYDTKYASSKIEISSQESDMILFPSWLPHDNNEVSTDEDRIILSFNTYS